MLFTYSFGVPSSPGTTMLLWNVIQAPQQTTFTKLVMELNLKDRPISLT